MENTSYALIVAGSTLVACMVIAVAVYVFNNLSIFQNAQDTVIERESIDEFNKAFEAYDKSLMYGADVLSCLNLAENNNQKYVYEVYQGDDNNEISYEARQDLIVNVSVTFKDKNHPLQESISVSARGDDGSVMQLTSAQCNPDSNLNGQGYPLKENKKLFSADSSKGLFKIPTITCYYFDSEVDSGKHGSAVVHSDDLDYSSIMWNSTALKDESRLKTMTYDTNVGKSTQTYNLVAESKLEEKTTAQLLALLSTATETEQTVVNDSYEGTGYKGDTAWLSATWTSAVSDFKTRKFVCEELTYNPNTGYVNSLSFVEYGEDE